MAMADRWGRPLDDVLSMSHEEFVLWQAYFKLQKDIRDGG
mgnify:CR=1 FL=1|jgi:hypothetical protein